ncbi:MAG: queuosine 5'-phosphate N-glycosylase/hydrolase [Anaerolineae bacterium]
MSVNPQDPLGVRAGARFVAEVSQQVTIDREALAAYCRTLALGAQVPKPEWESEFHFGGEGETTIAYVFCLDAINFCFWGDPKWRRPYRGQWVDGYWALAAALTEEVTANPRFLDADNLSQLDLGSLQRVLDGTPAIPLLEERATNLRELGRWVARYFGGRFAAVVQATGWDAIALVRLVVKELSSFRDEAAYKGRVVPFYKRAQILAADLHGALRSQAWPIVTRLDDLTAFADYKLPQLLRHKGVLSYAAPLAERVDNQLPLEAGCEEEVEIRANTVWAVELMRQELEALGVRLPSYQIDWLLWYSSQDSGHMKPYHRTRTIYY